MNTNMQGHNHGAKSHLLWMLGIGGVILIVLLSAGRSFQQALPYAIFLACPVMMAGMMFMMMRGGNDQHHGKDSSDHRDHDAPAETQDSASNPSAQSSRTNALG